MLIKSKVEQMYRYDNELTIRLDSAAKTSHFVNNTVPQHVEQSPLLFRLSMQTDLARVECSRPMPRRANGQIAVRPAAC